MCWALTGRLSRACCSSCALSLSLSLSVALLSERQAQICGSACPHKADGYQRRCRCGLPPPCTRVRDNCALSWVPDRSFGIIFAWACSDTLFLLLRERERARESASGSHFHSQLLRAPTLDCVYVFVGLLLLCLACHLHRSGFRVALALSIRFFQFNATHNRKII